MPNVNDVNVPPPSASAACSSSGGQSQACSSGGAGNGAQYTNNSLAAANMCSIIHTSSSSNVAKGCGAARRGPAALRRPRSALFTPCFSPQPSDSEDDDAAQQPSAAAAAALSKSCSQQSSAPTTAAGTAVRPSEQTLCQLSGSPSPPPVTAAATNSAPNALVVFLSQLKQRLKMPSRSPATTSTTQQATAEERTASPAAVPLGPAIAHTASRRHMTHGIVHSEQPYQPVHTTVHYTHYLVPDLLAITAAPYYWGVMDRYEAERLLDNKPEGTFLLRDSAQCEYLFSVSFRRYNRTLHARIEQADHRFSFDSYDPGVFSATTVTALIDNYKDPSRCLFFEPQLTHPLSRPFVFPLSHLCRASVISTGLCYDQLQSLPVPQPYQHYLGEYHYKQPVKQVNH